MKYDVKLITMNKELSVRGLTLKDELELFGNSFLSQYRFLVDIDKMIYNKIVDPIFSYEEFLDVFTVEDRDALLIGILHASYEDDFQIPLECQKCKKREIYKFTILDNCRIKYFTPGEDFQNLEAATKIRKTICYRKEEEIYEMIIKVPSLRDFHSSLKYIDQNYKTEEKRLSFTKFTLPLLLILDNVKVYKNDLLKIEIFKNKLNDLVAFIESLDLKIYKFLKQEYDKLYSEDLGVKIVFDFICSSCGFIEHKEYDPIDIFFLQV